MAGDFERVYETGHVYRAEPHASSRHLTEYYSLDIEFGFIEGPEEVIQLERELLTYIFKAFERKAYGPMLQPYREQHVTAHAGSTMLGVQPLPQYRAVKEQIQAR